MKWLVLGLFVALPLQWFALGSTPLGTARLHQIVILLISAVILIRLRPSSHSPVVRTAALFLSATVFMVAAWAVADIYNGVSPAGPVQVLLYVAAFVSLGTVFYQAASGARPELIGLLRWVALVTCGSVVLGFAISMAVNGVDPRDVLARTIATGDPELLTREVFKSSFASFGLDAETVAGNLRHEIFGGILFAMYVSSWAMRIGRPTTSAQRLAYRSAMVLGSVLLLISLSRSVLIAALVWPLIAFGRSLLLGRLTTSQLAVAFSGLVGVGLLAMSGFGLVIWNRFTTDTTGYDAREENYAGAFTALQESWLTGGVATSGLHVSSHNFVVDNWLRGGLFTGIAAAAVFALVIVAWLRLLTQVTRSPDWMVPVTAALALPVVRMATAGGGLIPPVEWVVLAFVVGVLAHRRQQRLADSAGSAGLQAAREQVGSRA